MADEVERYLRTGASDPHHAAWSGESFLEKAHLAHADLENALVAEVSRKANGWQPPSTLVGMEDLAAFTRARVEPMVRGLFPRAEKDAVMALVERSVVFLTPNNIEEVLRASRWRHISVTDTGPGTNMSSPERLLRSCGARPSVATDGR